MAAGECAVQRRSGGGGDGAAAELDAEYSEERLGKIAFNGGVE